MNGLDKIGVEATQLVPLNGQHIGLKPPGAMRDQIHIGADFDASLERLFDCKLEPAMFTKP